LRRFRERARRRCPGRGIDGSGRAAAAIVDAAGRGDLDLIAGDLGQRQNFGFDDAERRLASQLTAEQPYRLEISIHVIAAAADEASDEDPRERRDVHLRLDGRLDRNLVEIGAPDRGAQHQGASEYRDVSGSGH
jgi:hypothetical protein